MNDMLTRPPKLVGLVLAAVTFTAAPAMVMAFNRQPPVLAWIISLAAAMWTFRAIAAATGARLLTDERGRWSLSRLQLVAWTVLVLSTFWTMSATRMLAHAADPLALSVD